MSYSPLTEHVQHSPFFNRGRTSAITRITPHCTAGLCSISALGTWFQRSTTKASANYGIGSDGTIGCFVEEENRAWTSGSRSNDNSAITIECASTNTAPYTIAEPVLGSLVLLMADICKRYGKTRLVWIPQRDTALEYEPKEEEMLITVHRWFAATECPGQFLLDRLPELATEVNRLLQPARLYRVQIGAFKNREYAEDLLKQAQQHGFPQAFIVEEVK